LDVVERIRRQARLVEELLVEVTSRALNKPPSLEPASGRLSEALREFREEVLKIEGVVDVVIPDEEFHESNVLVVVSRVDLRVMEEIVKVKFSVEERYGDEITINPYIVLEGEEVVSKVKEASRGGCKRS
jgi:beta-galactosidase GanA